MTAPATRPCRSAPRALGQPTRPPTSRPRSSRRRCGRCSSSPAPARARPRRWPRASSGWSPTASSSPTRCSASPSPARPRPSWPSASPGGCAPARSAGLWTPADEERRRRACSAARPPSRPTTRMPGGSSASTACGWASSPSRGCSPRPRPGSSPHEVVERWDGPMDDVDKAESTVTDAVVARRRDGRAPASTPTTSSALPRRVRVAGARGAAQGRRAGQATCTRWRRGRPDRAAQRAAAVLPIVERYLRPQAQRDASTSPTRWPSPRGWRRSVPDIGARRAAALPGRAARRVPGHLARPSSCCCSRSSAPGEPVPVTAVGDPHQSIYGWRGASATTLTRFPREFADGAGRRRCCRCRRAGATTTRSSTSPTTSPSPLRPTRPGRRSQCCARRRRRPRPGRRWRGCDGRGRGGATSPTGSPRAGSTAAGARHAAARGAVPQALPVPPRSSRPSRRRACPSRSSASAACCHARGRRPRRAALVVQDPTRGDQLMRLLTGPSVPARRGRPRRARWRGRARCSGRDGAARRRGRAGAERPGAEPAGRLRGGGGARPVARRRRRPARMPPGPASGTRRRTAPTGQHRRGARRPAAGRVGRREGQRLLSARPSSGSPGCGEAVRRLRRLTGLPLADLVAEAERALGLDIEVLSRPGLHRRPRRGPTSTPSPTSAATFAASADRPTLAGFLAWLDAARRARSADSTRARSRPAPTPSRC